MENTDNLLWVSILTAIVSTLGAISAIASNLYKAKAERKKANAEGESAIAHAADSIASGAKISNDLLLQRLVELEEREDRREKELETLKEDLRRVKADLQDWKDYAFRLAHQVKSLGLETVPFRPAPRGEHGLRE